MNCIDLFSGVGGLSLGFKEQGFNVVLAVENDPEIATGYEKNFPETKLIVEDVAKIDFTKCLSETSSDGIDVVFGGPPCQGFSQKGKRLHLNDERNYLFRAFIDVVRITRPKFFVMENVPNILTASNRYFYREIEQEVKKLGYKMTAKVLNAVHFGVPQSRRRAFIVGFINKGYSFPEPTNKVWTVGDALSDLPFLYSGEGKEFYPYEKGINNDYQKRLRVGSDGVYHQAANHSKVALERLSMIPHEGGCRDSLPEEHRTKSIYSGTWSRMRSDRPARTVTTRFDTPSSGQFTLPTQDRCITVREAARLQSFPDRFIFTGSKGTQMKQVGNAVPPLLALAVASSLARFF